MTKRSNHYEQAFEFYLRDRRIAYVAVNEQRRSLITHGSLKSLDFIVSPSDAVSLLIDIKGRRFPSGEHNKQYWRNWSTWDDLQSMAQWQDKLGVGNCSLLVFAFDVVGTKSPVPAEQLYLFREHRYAFLAIRLTDYIQFARPLSAKWQTVSMPNRIFREAAFPFDDLLNLSDKSSRQSRANSPEKSTYLAAPPPAIKLETTAPTDGPSN